VINGGLADAWGCSITLGSAVPAVLTSWATDPGSNRVTSAPNPRGDILAGGFSTWSFRLVPHGSIAPTEIELIFQCVNTEPAGIFPGLNTLLLSASDDPTPDIVAIALNATRNGILEIDGSAGAGAFATATVNVGLGELITAEPRASLTELPLDLAICRTDPTSGACEGSIGPSVTTVIENQATPTFAVFATATSTIPLDPANYRIYIEVTDDLGEVRGSSSVAVTME